MKIRVPLLAVSLLLAARFSAFAAESSSGTPEALIRSLYARHQPGKHKELSTCKRSDLSKYCDSKLTDLLLKDCACSKMTHEVCNLDFDPFYGAQDFGEENPNPRVQRRGQSDRYDVTITNLGEVKLTYTMTKTKDGWRISDIETAEWDLLKILSGKVE